MLATLLGQAKRHKRLEVPLAAYRAADANLFNLVWQRRALAVEVVTWRVAQSERPGNSRQSHNGYCNR
ncbi:hypothetical protein GCM10007874_11380 [Labrys miyagiensis]|uniref:Uncharacterized protein n=1 Tax=Labrys miyagiensis TaxID=346912 RepID=A0ABQ6CCP2_9HYPH|nr:hypothetical protein GCM10007874_11380 [Labrys miyagiensis]